MKYIFITGGVVSGLGKGITAASIGLLLESRGYVVTNVKIDMYLNIDAGTIRPQEHGEVFVCEDGIETDQDLGNYERFLGKSLRRENYMTTGQVYKTVIDKERAMEYKGEDVEAIPHLTDEIIRRINVAGKVNKAEIVIIELGGTVGEYQNGIFYEASRILRLQQPRNVIQVHVSYLPVIKSLGELKSKPAQQSVHLLNSMGIMPDFLIARSEKEIDQKRRERLAMFCNMSDEDIIANPDLSNIYEVPIFLDKQKLADKIIKKLHLRKREKTGMMLEWKKFVEKLTNPKSEIKVAMVGKYFATGSFTLTDSYLCVMEALKHAGAENGVKVVVEAISTDTIEKEGTKILDGYKAIIVPQGWGNRGVEEKLKVVQYARENKIPYLGLCFGMQMAVIEFARNVVGLENANSEEVDSKTKYPVVHVMPDQKKYLEAHQYGGTIRLGAWPCLINKKSRLFDIYKQDLVQERHRHRYEFNNEFREQLEKAGMIISGTSPDGKLVEAIELPKEVHPFFVATQFHPEYISRPLNPHPIFVELIRVAMYTELR